MAKVAVQCSVDSFVVNQSLVLRIGNNALKIPKRYWEVCSEGRNMKEPSIPINTADKFIRWLKQEHTIGIYGDPIYFKKNS